MTTETSWEILPFDPDEHAAPGGSEHDCDGAFLASIGIEPESFTGLRSAPAPKMLKAAALKNASARGWGPGWPHCSTRAIQTLRRKDGVVLPVRKEIALLVAGLCDMCEAQGYNLVPGWCWGFACRAIAGTRTGSNHSWGLAVDLNAPNNPMTSRLVTDMPPWMPKLWKQYGFGWGGEYTSKKDAMHYEYLGTPVTAVEHTRRLYEGLLPLSFEEDAELNETQDQRLEDIHAALTDPKDPHNRLKVIDGLSDDVHSLRRMARAELRAQGYTWNEITQIEGDKGSWESGVVDKRFPVR